ncbi:MAG: GNAT family N-acetyltransferase [Planctomycetes bacterium]|nr:GNAT family N-acetyltransferase [Planctomycetota bacterium]
MAPRFDIRAGDLDDAAVRSLLREHLQMAAANSPPGAVHALDLDGLRADDVTFWTVHDHDQLCGCGALRELEPRHGEIKSMRTATSHLRRGVAAQLMEHVLAVAAERGYQRLSLETGNTEAFAPARRLYQRFGFVPCAPFADYVDDGFSVCMTRAL